ncbi:MAG: restriction endonuclease [Candidatus Acidiferrales bacterium]
MRKSDLPFGSEFSPTQIDLRNLLELAKKYGGHWKEFEKAVCQKYFWSRAGTSEYNRKKLANNCKLGMQAYGIIDDDATLTELGERLHSLRQSENQLYAALARHILLELHGMTLIQCIRDMQASAEPIDLIRLREWLEERGVHFPRGGRHSSSMRLWLEKAGIFRSGWALNEAVLSKVLGIDEQQFEVLTALSPEQRAFVKALMNLGGPGPYHSNQVERLATATYGQKFNEKNLPKSVLYPLQQAGYIDLQRGTKQIGRGAKPFLVTPTPKLVKELLEPLLLQIEKVTASDLRPYLRKPLVQIVAEVDSPDRHVRGLALEALALRLMRLIDLDYVATRLRGVATDGAEVDVIFESERLVFSRWQVQCKSTSKISVDDVAKEVGLTHVSKSNVVVVVSTGRISADARRYASIAERARPVQIVMIDGTYLRRMAHRPASIVELFHTKNPLLLARRAAFSLIAQVKPHGRVA